MFANDQWRSLGVVSRSMWEGGRVKFLSSLLHTQPRHGPRSRGSGSGSMTCLDRDRPTVRTEGWSTESDRSSTTPPKGARGDRGRPI